MRARPGAGSPIRQDVFLDRFGTVLVLVLATICAQSLVDVSGSPLSALFTHAISGLALIVAVRAGGVRRRWRHGADVLVAVTLSLNLALVLLPHLGIARGTQGAQGEILWLVAAGLLPVAVARRVATHVEVTLQTVMGAVASYLQIAVAFASLYQFLDVISGHDLFGRHVSSTSYTYLSLQSISTVGFGDLVPVTDLGHLATVSEAVVGQVFLVTFVALIVARFAAPPHRGPGERP